MGYLAQIFRGVNNTQAMQSRNLHLPRINDITASFSNYFASSGQSSKKKKLMSLVKATPELVGLINKVSKDIVYKYHFENVTSNQSGRNKIQKAERFAQEVVLRKLMLSQVFDQLAVGEAFSWLGTIKEDNIKEEIDNILRKEIFIESKEKDYINQRVIHEMKLEGYSNVYKIDEDVLKPRKYRYMASTTMETMYDQYDIIGYKQIVGINEEDFSTDEIVRFTFEDIDGKISGFTPIESVIVQIELLRQMWQNQLSLSVNGGVPDHVFSFKNMHPSDPTFTKLKQQIQKYKLAENKHGNLVFTGDVDIQSLQQLDKMQYMDTGLYITGLMALQWEIPRSSIPFIVGGTNNKDDTGGNSEKGYWRNIEQSQQIYADTMNTQLWIPYFGVKIVFDNAYVQQDVQVETALGLKYNNIISMDNILNKSKKMLSEKKRMELLRLNDDDIEDYDPMEIPMQQAELAAVNNPTLSKNEVNDSNDDKNKKKKKKDEQIAVTQSRGMAPTGVSKEYHEIKESERMRVNMQQFLKVYNQDKAFNNNPPKIFMIKEALETTFIYKSTYFVYETKVLTLDIEKNNVWLMNMGYNVYLIESEKDDDKEEKMEAKQWNGGAEMEYKEMLGSEPLVVDRATFLKVYNQDKAFNNNPPRVFVRQGESSLTFIYKSTDFVYKTTLNSLDTLKDDIFLMNISGNLYKL